MLASSNQRDIIIWTCPAKLSSYSEKMRRERGWYTYKYYLTKNWLKKISKLLLKYALTEDCFRLFSWRSSILFVIVDDISWLSSSKKGYHFILSSIMIISLKPMLSCIVGHLPKNLSEIFHQFMKIPNCTIGYKVAGKVEQVMILRFLSSIDLLVPKKQLNGQKRTWKFLNT